MAFGGLAASIPAPAAPVSTPADSEAPVALGLVVADLAVSEPASESPPEQPVSASAVAMAPAKNTRDARDVTKSP